MYHIDVDQVMMSGKKFGFTEVSAAVDTSMGFYVGSSRMDITTGWQRYCGDPLTFEIQRGYLSIGKSFYDGFRFPLTNSLNAPWKYWGFRIRAKQSVHIYAVVRLLDGSSRKIFVSSGHNSWGFTGLPVDEYCVPLGFVPKDKWHVIIVDVSSFKDDFESPIQAINGVLVRGPLYLSHIWCVEDTSQITNKFRSVKLVSYPNK